MDFIYKNDLEESDTHLTDFTSTKGRLLLKEKGLYKIIWAKEKIDHITIDGCETTLSKNEVLFCTPLNYVNLPEDQNSVMAILFNREFYCIRDNDDEVSCNGFLFYGSAHPVIIQLNDKEQQDFEIIYSIFLEEFNDMEKSQGEMVRAMLKRLIIKGTRVAMKQEHKDKLPIEKYDLIRRMHVLVEKNFKKKHKVSDYAEILFKSPKTLANVFKKFGDQTPLQVINQRLILEARRLLIFSDLTSEQIAYELGFKESTHFSKFFKQHLKCSPIVFKKKALLNHKGTMYHL